MLALSFETGDVVPEWHRTFGRKRVHEECERVAAMINPACSITVWVDGRDRPSVFSPATGDRAHSSGCQAYLPVIPK